MKLRTLSALVVTLTIFGSGLYAGAATVGASYAAGASPYESLDTFARVLSQVERFYVEPVESNALVYQALEGLTDSLDNHSLFLDPEAYAELLRNSEGSYSGIGVEVTPHADGGLEVVEVVPEGPAFLAGIRGNDRVLEVDGTDVTTLPFREAVDRVRGPRGEPVTLGIQRQGTDERLQIQVMRDEVQAPAVRSELVEPGLAYIRVEQFRRHASEEFATALAELQADTDLAGLVIDLRDNPGGLLEEAVAIVDALVDQGTIVTTQGRSAGASETHTASAEPTDLLKETVVVLVDGSSASASEIVAGALQDLGRATIVGQPTYGKGSVQSVFEYQDRSALRLTVARYHLPSGRSIEVEGGIEPDVIQNRTAPRPSAAQRLEEQLAALSGIDESQREGLLKLVRALDLPDAEERGPPRFTGTVHERALVDLQLRRALELAGSTAP